MTTSFYAYHTNDNDYLFHMRTIEMKQDKTMMNKNIHSYFLIIMHSNCFTYNRVLVNCNLRFRFSLDRTSKICWNWFLCYFFKSD